MESRGRYELLRSLGRGGMAEVFLARFVGPHGFARPVVIKRVLPQRANDIELARRLIDEARIGARLHHQHIAQIFELGDDRGTPFLALEHVDGKDLRVVLERLRARGERMPLRLALLVVRDLLSALAHAHALRGDDGELLGLVHRDVSSTNVLVSWGGVVKLIDFGIAKANDNHARTVAGAVLGKAKYMSPEQMRGERVDARTDVYAVGVLLHLLLTDTTPGDAAAAARAQVPGPLRSVLAGALAEDAADRFTAAAMLRALAPEGRAPEIAAPAELGAWLRELFRDEHGEHGSGADAREELDQATQTRSRQAPADSTDTRVVGPPLAAIESQLASLDDGTGLGTRLGSDADLDSAVHDHPTRIARAAPTTELWTDDGANDVTSSTGIGSRTTAGPTDTFPPAAAPLSQAARPIPPRAVRRPRGRRIARVAAVGIPALCGVVILAVTLARMSARSTDDNARPAVAPPLSTTPPRESAPPSAAASSEPPPLPAPPSAPAAAPARIVEPPPRKRAPRSRSARAGAETTNPSDATGAASASGPREAPAATAEVIIRTTPSGARVVIDGSDVGTTPLRVALTPGLHELELVDGEHTKQLPLMVRLGAKPTVLELRMR